MTRRALLTLDSISSGSLASSLGGPISCHKRSTPRPGETKDEFATRRDREEEREAYHAADHRRAGGRVHPVFPRE